jgi:hypothetical protein
VVAGILAGRFGPEFGGLFLAFPAIFPATVIEKHERKRKDRVGLPKATRGREAAALDARGVTMGSIGLVGFALAGIALDSNRIIAFPEPGFLLRLPSI